MWPNIAKLRALAGRTSVGASEELLRKYAFGIILDNPKIQPLIKGAHVLEVGPGDHLSTGLVFLAYGAKSYTALDRFQGNYKSDLAKDWYELVLAKWRQHFPDIDWPESLDVKRFPDVLGVTTLNASIEDLDKLPSDAFDLVVSQAVGEHVSDIDMFARSTFKILKKGGTAMHNVDFSCHGFFSDQPLFFLTIPEFVWRLMGSARGIPNRKRIHELEFCFKQNPFESVEIVSRSTTTAGIPASLSGLPVESLLTNWASFILRK